MTDEPRNALLLTVIDIYSKVLIHMLRHRIKKGDVLLMLSLMLLEYKAEGMSIRNDNGSQFIAAVVREYLREKGIYQSYDLLLPLMCLSLSSSKILICSSVSLKASSFSISSSKGYTCLLLFYHPHQ
jgi:hypothetical protein